LPPIFDPSRTRRSPAGRAYPCLQSSELTPSQSPSQSGRRSRCGTRPRPSYQWCAGLHSLASPSASSCVWVKLRCPRPETYRRVWDSATTAGSVKVDGDYGSLQWIQVVSGSPLHLYIPISGNALLSSPPLPSLLIHPNSSSSAHLCSSLLGCSTLVG